MDILEFVMQEALVMIPVLNIIGWVIKSTETITDRLILPIISVASLLLTPWLLGGFNAENVVQAFLVVGGAVLLNQGVRQLRKDD